MSLNFGQIGPPTTELAALESLRNTPIDLIMGKMVFLLFFHVTRTSIKAWMSSIFFKMRSDLGTLDSGDRVLPFGLLVSSV